MVRPHPCRSAGATEEIHPGIDAGKRFAQMREAFDDALVTGWQELEPGIRLPDLDDRHVVAAAVRGGAQGIITANAKDFPATALEPFGLEAVHPDDFLLDQLDLSPPTILQVIRDQAARTRRPPLTPRDLATSVAGFHRDHLPADRDVQCPADHRMKAISQAVAGLHQAGYSWTEIAARLGVTRQAAQQRWGRS